jgi:putative hemolysin
MQLHIDDYINNTYSIFEKLTHNTKSISIKLFKSATRNEQFLRLIDTYKHQNGHEVVKSLLAHFRIDITIKNQQLGNIPPLGRAVIIANQPLGSLDSLALIDAISSIRTDIKIVTNSFIAEVDLMKGLMIPITDSVNYKNSTKAIYKALSNEQIVVMFPSLEVGNFATDNSDKAKWKNSFYKIASKSKSPIIPIYIRVKNSLFFSILSRVNSSMAHTLLPGEMLRSFAKTIEFKMGKQIPYLSYYNPQLNPKQNVKILKKHFYSIANDNKEIYKTYDTISEPQTTKAAIIDDLQSSMLLGSTLDNKQIYLFDAEPTSALLLEIGRLREMTFRYVGEGTGKKSDTDDFDLYYKHIVLWDKDEEEVVGAYRIGEAKEIIESKGIDGLYTSRIFEYHTHSLEMLKQGIELGRSFVQPKYWGSRALDYLWQGIGAYVRFHPRVKYLFGAVSISDRFNEYSKALMVDFYTNYFGASTKDVEHRNRYIFDYEYKLKNVFCYDDYKKDMRTLKKELEFQGFSLPTLYKQYTEVCEADGVKFYDFGYDMQFGNCLDGFIIVDLDKLKPQKRERYIKTN